MAENSVWLVFELETGASGPGISGNAFPDVEAILAEWLRDGALAVGDRVYSRIPADPVFPLITVARLGGVPSVKLYQDSALVQVSVWGNSKSEARDIADAARRRTQQLQGVLGDDYFTHAVEDAQGLTWLPDQETGRDRYLFGVLVYFR